MTIKRDYAKIERARQLLVEAIENHANGKTNLGLVWPLINEASAILDVLTYPQREAANFAEVMAMVDKPVPRTRTK